MCDKTWLLHIVCLFVYRVINWSNFYNNVFFFLLLYKQTLGFTNSEHIVITGLTSLNSQLVHILINACHNVKMHGVKLMADGNSPNTDGIHVKFSTDVTILAPRIRTGDDCISVGPGCRNLWVEDVACGPGHGIRFLLKILYEFYWKVSSLLQLFNLLESFT